MVFHQVLCGLLLQPFSKEQNGLSVIKLCANKHKPMSPKQGSHTGHLTVFSIWAHL